MKNFYIICFVIIFLYPNYPQNQRWFCDYFDQFGWTLIGPLGISNWSLKQSNNAGGVSPELSFYYAPTFVGESIILSPKLATTAGTVQISFNHLVDHYGPGYTLCAGYTTDSGAILHQLWTITPSGNIGPETLTLNFDAPDSNWQWYFMVSGDSYQIDYWYIDDWCTDAYMILNPPTNLNSQLVYDPIGVKLTWQSNSVYAQIFEIFRKLGGPGPDYTLLESVPGYMNSYIDTTVFACSTYTYAVKTASWYSTSAYSNPTTITIPVPVDLISFTGSVHYNHICLNWSTATETNNKLFEVERNEFVDCKKQFTKIASVEGKGTTTEKQDYTYIDKNLNPGTYIYRLKQIDYDGTYEYSYEVQAKVEAPQTYSLEQNYPNPFNPNTTISFGLPADSRVVLKIYNVLGEEIITLLDKDLAAGMHKIEFNASYLNSGVYFYKINTKRADGKSFSSVKKMIISK